MPPSDTPQPLILIVDDEVRILSALKPTAIVLGLQHLSACCHRIDDSKAQSIDTALALRSELLEHILMAESLVQNESDEMRLTR